ncbi:MAG: hypothetical protein H6714_03035 [Myxococcales bacterium]|nr:hypothetical protein [Myxococcales bacterium]
MDEQARQWIIPVGIGAAPTVGVAQVIAMTSLTLQLRNKSIDPNLVDDIVFGNIESWATVSRSTLEDAGCLVRMSC